MVFLYVGMRRGKRLRLYSLHHLAAAVAASLIAPHAPVYVVGVGSFCFPGQPCFAAVIKLLVSANLITVPSVTNKRRNG